MSEEDSGRWEERFDLDSMPDIEMIASESPKPSPQARNAVPPDAKAPDLESSDDPLFTLEHAKGPEVSSRVDDDLLDEHEVADQEDEDEPLTEAPRVHASESPEVDEPEAPGELNEPESPEESDESKEFPAAEEDAQFQSEDVPTSDPVSDPFSAWIDGSGDGRRVRVRGSQAITAVASHRSPPVVDPFSRHVSGDGLAAAKAIETGPVEDPEPTGGVSDTEDDLTSSDAHGDEMGPLAPVVPISAMFEAAEKQRLAELDAEVERATQGLGEEFNELLGVMSDEELARATAFLESRLTSTTSESLDEDSTEAISESLAPLSAALADRGDVEVRYGIEEIEDIIDARLPEAARVDPDWWSNRPDASDVGYAAAWRGSGWWAYPELDESCVRFRRTL